jgi:hypothetical protein
LNFKKNVKYILGTKCLRKELYNKIYCKAFQRKNKNKKFIWITEINKNKSMIINLNIFLKKLKNIIGKIYVEKIIE